MAKLIFELTRDVVHVVKWQEFDGTPTGKQTEIVIRAGRRVFNGGKRKLAAHLAALNAEHGAGYAREWTEADPVTA